MSKENSLTRITLIKNLFWKFSERMTSQVVTFIISVILARLLSPSDYGIIAIINVFISIANTLVTSGFASSLIQKKDADELDFSSIFFVNLLSSTFIYILLFFSSEAIARFYNIPELYLYLRVLGLQIIIYALNSVQQAYLYKHMMFKNYFFSTLSGTIVSGMLGVFMAYLNFGVWALIFQSLSSSIINATVLWFMVKWRPIAKVSIYKIKTLFDFGWKMLCSALLASAYEQITALLIGKVYSSADLAYYNRGQNYPSLLVTNINSSINSILFPAISNIQNDKKRVVMITRRAIQLSLFVLAPMLVGLSVIAKPLILIMLTEKWLPCVPFLQLFCIYFLIKPIQTASLSAIQALGNSGLYLRLEFIKDLIGFILLLILIRYSVYLMTVSVILANLVSVLVNAVFIKKEIGYSYINQLRDVFPYISIAIVMGLAIKPMVYLADNLMVLLFFQITFGAIIYIIGSVIFKVDAFIYILNLIKEKKNAK